MRTLPARVLKNMKLPGHMGNVAVTIKNLEVVDVRLDENVILIRGAIPGTREGFLEVTPAAERIESRPELKRGGKEEKKAQEATEAAEGAAEGKTAPTEEANEPKAEETQAKENA